VRLEGLFQLKNPMTSSGIEPATFRLLTQCLNQLRYRVLPHFLPDPLQIINHHIILEKMGSP
jgi:hypothetical protein